MVGSSRGVIPYLNHVNYVKLLYYVVLRLDVLPCIALLCCFVISIHDLCCLHGVNGGCSLLLLASNMFF